MLVEYVDRQKIDVRGIQMGVLAAATTIASLALGAALVERFRPNRITSHLIYFLQTSSKSRAVAVVALLGSGAFAGNWLTTCDAKESLPLVLEGRQKLTAPSSSDSLQTTEELEQPALHSEEMLEPEESVADEEERWWRLVNAIETPLFEEVELCWRSLLLSIWSSVSVESRNWVVANLAARANLPSLTHSEVAALWKNLSDCPMEKIVEPEVAQQLLACVGWEGEIKKRVPIKRAALAFYVGIRLQESETTWEELRQQTTSKEQLREAGLAGIALSRFRNLFKLLV